MRIQDRLVLHNTLCIAITHPVGKLEYIYRAFMSSSAPKIWPCLLHMSVCFPNLHGLAKCPGRLLRDISIPSEITSRTQFDICSQYSAPANIAVRAALSQAFDGSSYKYFNSCVQYYTSPRHSHTRVQDFYSSATCLPCSKTTKLHSDVSFPPSESTYLQWHLQTSAISFHEPQKRN